MVKIIHRIHGAAIYGNIYHQYTPIVSICTSTMDPMGKWVTTPVANQANDSWDDPASGISG